MRYCIYGHLTAFVICGMCAVAERFGVLQQVDSFPLWAWIVVAAFFWSSLLAWFVCPLVSLFLLLLVERPWRHALAAFVAELLLWVAQYWVLMLR